MPEVGVAGHLVVGVRRSMPDGSVAVVEVLGVLVLLLAARAREPVRGIDEAFRVRWNLDRWRCGVDSKVVCGERRVEVRKEDGEEGCGSSSHRARTHELFRAP